MQVHVNAESFYQEGYSMFSQSSSGTDEQNFHPGSEPAQGLKRWKLDYCVEKERRGGGCGAGGNRDQ